MLLTISRVQYSFLSFIICCEFCWLSRLLQGFNREMEEIQRVQKAFASPDPELRDTLRDDNRQFVLPYYTAFLKRYRTVPFSRNPDKYIKYTEQDICQFIDGFFDAAS